MPIPLLGETVAVYSGEFEGSGALLLRHPLPEGTTTLKGRLDVQQCSDTVCEAPLRIPFEVSLKLEPFVVNERDRRLLEQQKARAIRS